MNPSGIEVRQLSEIPEFAEAVQLQKRIWGFADVELLPVRLFIVADKIGGHAFGAFEGGRMVGFCLAIPGLKPGGKYYLHSHMLGVLPDYNNRGIGRLMKLRQREDAVARGIELVEWTFDPLEIKNAYFNVERLGAIIRRYVPNQYGSSSSFLHGGLPTDRCVAEWWVSSPRVEGAIHGKPCKRPEIEARISVPAAIDRLRREDRREARAIQQTIAGQFREYFDRGLAVVGFEKSEESGTYLLGQWR
ncbi:MAG: GNAT family N-acetyltransferase [Bryobacteraceae bacterium]